MDFIPKSIASNQNFSPLMRFFHDVDKYSSQLTHPRRHHSADSGSHGGRAFFPNFDVRELRNTFELYGELPGVEKNDIKIEFTGARTLEISGIVKSCYDLPSCDQGNHTKENEAEDLHQSKSKRSHKGEEDGGVRYWASERNLGEFYRSFTFPKQIQQGAVTAILDSGVLIVTVPKAAEAETDRRVIEVA